MYTQPPFDDNVSDDMERPRGDADVMRLIVAIVRAMERAEDRESPLACPVLAGEAHVAAQEPAR